MVAWLNRKAAARRVAGRKSIGGANPPTTFFRGYNMVIYDKEFLAHGYAIRRRNRLKTIKLLGGICEMCGESNLRYLTFDHVNNDGYLEGKRRSPDVDIRKALRSGVSLEEIKHTYQVLCYNCNCGVKRRAYMETPINEDQRYQLKFWLVGYHFFGPCKTCGDTDLRHLTVSHIRDDGFKIRQNKENGSWRLFLAFNKSGWPESLKDDYCLECFNCNCSRAFSTEQLENLELNSNLRQRGCAEIITIRCSACHKDFELLLSAYQKRVKQSSDGRVYCSRSCASKTRSYPPHTTNGNRIIEEYNRDPTQTGYKIAQKLNIVKGTVYFVLNKHKKTAVS